METKTCKHCGATKPESEFRMTDNSCSKGFYHSTSCKPCRLAKNNRWRSENIVHVRELARIRYEINGGKKGTREQYLAHRTHILETRKQRRERLRTAVINILGNKCAKCGYDADIRALQVDHINGGGSAERRTIYAEGVLRKIIATNGAGYQILCANCNWIKRIENKEHR